MSAVRWIVLGMALGLVGGCGEEAVHDADVPQVTNQTSGSPDCDAGDAAFVRRVMPLLWGRKPASIREVNILAQVVQETDRATLVRAMARTGEYRRRWTHFLSDILWVNRTGLRSNRGCYNATQLPSVTSELAEFVRDNPADVSVGFPKPWTMADLVASSLVLDDLSPLYRAHLFGQLGTSDVFAVDDPNEELGRRDNFVNVYERSYLHRRLECLGCHNSEFSVTGSSDPSKDRTWEVPGHYEKALFGNSVGRARQDLYPFFRVGGQLSLTPLPEEQGPQRFGYAEGAAPWGLAFECGNFFSKDEIQEDSLGYSGYLGQDFGTTASLWDIEALLDNGFSQLRQKGFVVPQTQEALLVSASEGFARLVVMNVVDQVWSEAFGRRLTIANYFPRNQYQRDILTSLATVFVGSGYSLVEVLVATTTHPYFNALPPARCSHENPYFMAPVFAPLASDNENEEQRLNSVGDIIHRLAPRVLMSSVSYAMGWSASLEFFQLPPQTLTFLPRLPNEAQFQREIGTFLKDTETGFRGTDFQVLLAWESRFTQCVDPRSLEAPDSPVVEPREDDGQTPNTGDQRQSGHCKNVCDSFVEGAECQCDVSCLNRGDCCHDYLEVCSVTGPDFIERMVTAADDNTTLEDAVLALKDRLLTQPLMVSDTERTLVEQLLGLTLATPLLSIDDPDAKLRQLCGVWLNTPQFLLTDVAEDIGTAPKELWVVPGTAHKELCESLAHDLFEHGVMACNDNSFSLNNPPRQPAPQWGSAQ